MRVYLYTDGENFTIRAQERDAELKANKPEAERLAAQVESAVGMHAPGDALALWAQWYPEPHRPLLEDPALTKNGVLFTRDEVYWDALGLFLALRTSLPSRPYNQGLVDRAYYFTGAAGPNIEQRERDLHALGFTPHVSVKVKPDSFAQAMKEEGITVISRPKPVDILIATRVLEDCMADNFDLCIFVGGDEDYVPLLEAVRRRGKQVWLVVFERWLAKRGRLRLACDRFIAYDPVIAFRPLP